MNSYGRRRPISYCSMPEQDCPISRRLRHNNGKAHARVGSMSGRHKMTGNRSKCTASHMSFAALKLRPELGANRIKTDDAYSFVAHLRLSYQSKPHWRAARQALDNVCASNVGEIRAWRTFRAAVSEEGWLSD